MSDYRFRFTWLRESLRHELQYDAGLRIRRDQIPLAVLGLISPKRTERIELSQVVAAASDPEVFANLPGWARKRLRIALTERESKPDFTKTSENLRKLLSLSERIERALQFGVTEIHLPYFDRFHWLYRFDVLDEIDFCVHGRRLMPASLVNNQELMNAHEAAILSVSGAALQFLDHRIQAGTFARLYSPVTLHRRFLAFHTIDVTTNISLPGPVTGCWRNAPAESRAAYRRVHTPVSITIQKALRKWMAWSWFLDLARCEDYESTRRVLCYLGSRPAPARSRTNFSHDVLDPQWTKSALRTCRRSVREGLDAIHPYLLQHGKDELARKYRPMRDQAITQRALGHKRELANLFAHESQIVDHILRFGAILRSGHTPRDQVRAAIEFAHGLGTRLRAMNKGVDLTYLAPMLMIEATNALNVSLGGLRYVQHKVRVRKLIA